MDGRKVEGIGKLFTNELHISSYRLKKTKDKIKTKTPKLNFSFVVFDVVHEFVGFAFLFWVPLPGLLGPKTGLQGPLLPRLSPTLPPWESLPGWFEAQDKRGWN